MAPFRLSPEAEFELDDIWLYIARASGSIDIANRVIDRVTDRFWLLARYPYIGRSREHDLRPGLRSFAVDDYVIIHRVESDGVVVILHVVSPGRNLSEWLGNQGPDFHT